MNITSQLSIKIDKFQVVEIILLLLQNVNYILFIFSEVQVMNKPIKMIVTDLDGTLLRGDKTVSDRNRLALSRCRELGIKVIFATGRS